MLPQIVKEIVRANSFLLSIASPILHYMMSGRFAEGTTKQVSLEDIDAKF